MMEGFRLSRKGAEETEKLRLATDIFGCNPHYGYLFRGSWLTFQFRLKGKELAGSNLMLFLYWGEFIHPGPYLFGLWKIS